MRLEYGQRTDRQVPKEVQAHLTRVGGRNRFGEPNYRLVWGPSRLEWMGAKFEAPEFGLPHVGVHRVPRYPADEWVLERWLAPETYGDRTIWKAMYTKNIDGHVVDTLGPFPTTGDYEAVTSFPPLELNLAVADLLVQVIERSRATSRGDRREAITGKLEKKQRDWENDVEAIIDDAFPSFHGAPYVHLST